MERVVELKERLNRERPVAWDDLPDISLYKDQVVSYMQRQLISFEEEAQLTSAMINNYIKDKLLPRADGKKYNRDHLAALTEIRALKQILSVKDIGTLLERDYSGKSQKEFYEEFRSILDEALDKTSQLIEADHDIKGLKDLALRLAISSYSQKLACIRLIDIIRETSEEQARERAEKERAKKKAEEEKAKKKLEEEKSKKKADEDKAKK